MEETAQERSKAIATKAPGFLWKAHISPSCLYKKHWRWQGSKHSPNKRNSFPEKIQLAPEGKGNPHSSLCNQTLSWEG